MHAKHYKHNEDGRTAPGVCSNGSVPLSHSGNAVTRIQIHTHTHTLFSDGWMTYDFMSFSTVFQSYQDDGRLIMKGCVQCRNDVVT